MNRCEIQVLDFVEVDAAPTFGRLTVQEGRLTYDTMWYSGQGITDLGYTSLSN